MLREATKLGNSATENALVLLLQFHKMTNGIPRKKSTDEVTNLKMLDFLLNKTAITKCATAVREISS